MGKSKPKGSSVPKAPKKRKRGRQPEISPERVALLTEAAGNFLPRMQAARMARISYATYRNWVRRGEAAWHKAQEDENRVKEDDRIYVDLFLGIGESLANAISESLEDIKKAGKKNWQAQAWILARVCPDDFGDNRLEIREMKKEFGQLLKELAELKNSRPPDVPVPEIPKPPDLPPPVPIPGGFVASSEPVPLPAVEPPVSVTGGPDVKAAAVQPDAPKPVDHTLLPFLVDE